MGGLEETMLNGMFLQRPYSPFSSRTLREIFGLEIIFVTFNYVFLSKNTKRGQSKTAKFSIILNFLMVKVLSLSKLIGFR